jgi:hypothetical protein
MVRRTKGCRATWRPVSEDFWVEIRGFVAVSAAMMQIECAKYDGVCYVAVESCLFVRPANVGLRKNCLLNYLKLYRGAGSLITLRARTWSSHTRFLPEAPRHGFHPPAQFQTFNFTTLDCQPFALVFNIESFLLLTLPSAMIPVPSYVCLIISCSSHRLKML